MAGLESTGIVALRRAGLPDDGYMRSQGGGYSTTRITRTLPVTATVTVAVTVAVTVTTTVAVTVAVTVTATVAVTVIVIVTATLELILKQETRLYT